LGGGLDEARLLSSYVKPAGTHGIDPRISYWKNKGWAVVTQASSKSDAIRLGRRIQNNLVAPSKLHYSDPYVHTLPLFVIYDGGEWVRIEPDVNHMGSATKISAIKPISVLSSDQRDFIKDVNKAVADEFRRVKLEGWTIKLVALWTSDLNQQSDAAKLKRDGFGGKSIMVGVPHALVVWEMDGTVKGADVGRFSASILLSQDAKSAVMDKIKKETFPHANPKILGEKIVQGFLGGYQDVAEQQRREERVLERAKAREEARALNDAMEAEEKAKAKAEAEAKAKAEAEAKKVVPKKVDQDDAKDTITFVVNFLKGLDYGPAGYATFVRHDKNDKAFYITTTKDTAQNEWYVDEDEDDDTARDEASWDVAYKSRIISLVQRALNRKFGGGVLTVDVDRTGAVSVDYANLEGIK
jgi:hypothetical protein